MDHRPSWRCGESNPGPPSSSCRILRAQLPVGCRLEGSRQPFPSEPIRNWLGPAVPETRRGHPALATPWPGGAGTQRTGRATYLSGSQRHLWFGTYCVYPVVLRGTGNLGSLPTRRSLNVESKSPPCPVSVQLTIQSRGDKGTPLFFGPVRSLSGCGPPCGLLFPSPGAAPVP